MEALADFGTVNLLGVQTFTNAIYRVWFEAFDRDAAMQLATLLVSVTLTLLVLERLVRGRARHAQLAARGDLVPPVRLRGIAAVAAAVVPLALVALVVGAPLVQLGVWSVQSIRDGPAADRVRRVGAQQPAPLGHERRARADRRAAARLRGALERVAGRPPPRRAPLRSATACRAPSSPWQ